MDLKEISIFKNLSDEDLNYIKDNIKVEEKNFVKNEIIFRQYDVARDFYYLIEGKVVVFKIDSEGKRYIIQNFKNPSIFGEVYAHLNESYDFTAQVEEDSKILVIKDFKNIFNLNTPRDFLNNYINLVSKKCLALSKKNQITSQTTLRKKIANYLLVHENEGVVKLEISREELADSLATTRPSLSRELSSMVADRLIGVKSKMIYINDRKKLVEIL